VATIRTFGAGALAVAALSLLGGCGSAHSKLPLIAKVDRAAPAGLAQELRHTYEPLQGCVGRSCRPFLRRVHDDDVLLHRSTALAPGTLPRAVAEAKLDGQTVTLYLYRSQTGQLCDYATVTGPTGPITGGLTPGLPCVPGRPCGAICLMQLHCCGANVIVGTVTTRADELRTMFDDNTTARYRLDQLPVPGRPARRFFVLDLRPHDFADPVRLFANGRLIASTSVAGLG
jgi:hypothetical protein